MSCTFRLLLAMAPAALPAAAGAQTAVDTLPERVVDRVYETINRCEVRKGKIVHEWESDLFASGATSRP
jgi:hypothetical protein